VDVDDVVGVGEADVSTLIATDVLDVVGDEVTPVASCEEEESRSESKSPLSSPVSPSEPESPESSPSWLGPSIICIERGGLLELVSESPSSSSSPLPSPSSSPSACLPKSSRQL
jgi:hypothetical protein